MIRYGYDWAKDWEGWDTYLAHVQKLSEAFPKDDDAFLSQVLHATFLSMQVRELKPGSQMASFAIVTVNMFQFLEDLHTKEPLGPLCGQADHTFNVESLGYAWGAHGVVLFRKLAGRWRRTFIPLVWVCYPNERKRSYDIGIKLVKDELQKRK